MNLIDGHSSFFDTDLRFFNGLFSLIKHVILFSGSFSFFAKTAFNALYYAFNHGLTEIVDVSVKHIRDKHKNHEANINDHVKFEKPIKVSLLELCFVFKMSGD